MRRFTYDSLSRLQTATNPESSLISYSYDANGNVLKKTSPTPSQNNPATTTKINYCYDALNRPTSKANNITTCPPSSSFAAYSYDAGTNGIGRRTGMTDLAGSTTWTHDSVGRISSEVRISQSVTKTMSYVYNQNGSVRSITYPSTRVVNYKYSGAGRALSAIDPTGPINYVTSATYTPPGGLSTSVEGFVSGGFTGMTTANTYDSREQPVLISAASPTASILSLCYDFHSHVTINLSPCSFAASPAGDNGNVYHIVNNRDGNRTQNFTYDNLNRISQGYTSGTNWGETFTIDAWGNLTNRGPVTGKTNYEALNAAPATSLNQLPGLGYDAAGNVTSNGSAAYTYNATGLLKTAGGATYTYDGDEQRIQKAAPAVTLYWYGATGNVLDETNGSGTLISEYIYFDGKRVARRDADNSVKYYFADSLGSASVVTNSLGAMPPLEESDYYPYGGEIPITNGDPNRYKFTGKERDTESGLDDFGARYYGSSLGRFVTPDEPLEDQDPASPQSWNLYTYVRNDPTIYSDPTGNACVQVGFGGGFHDDGNGGESCAEVDAAEKRARDQADRDKAAELAAIERMLRAYDAAHPGPRPDLGAVNDVSPDIVMTVVGGKVGSLLFGRAFGYIGGLFGSGAADAAGGVAGDAAAGVSAQTERELAAQAAKALSKEQRDLLKEFLGDAMKGVQSRGANFEIPPGLTRETLETYKSVAEAAISAGKDAGGVQAERLILVNRALAQIN